LPAPRRPKTPTTTPIAEGSPGGSRGRSRASSASSPTSPLGFAGEAFRRPEQPPTTKDAAALEAERLAQEQPPPEPIQWDEAKAEPVLTAFGYLLHSLDNVAGEPYAPDLWKMTQDDLDAIAAPLARIANRYEMTRRVAGASDEISLGVAVWPYAKRNLQQRGRALGLARVEQRTAPSGGYERAQPAPPSEPEPEEPVEDPRVADGDVFEFGAMQPPPQVPGDLEP
jgi:hypothetical protein